MLSRKTGTTQFLTSQSLAIAPLRALEYKQFGRLRNLMNYLVKNSKSWIHFIFEALILQQNKGKFDYVGNDLLQGRIGNKTRNKNGQYAILRK